MVAAVQPNGQTYHLHPDHLGTPRLITNAAKAKVAYHVYYPYGEELSPINQDGERLKYTGHERDLGVATSNADDLDYMHARFYNPRLGKLLSFDAALLFGKSLKRPQTWNRYAYARNNPLILVDPTGLAEVHATLLGEALTINIDGCLSTNTQEALQQKMLLTLENINMKEPTLSADEVTIVRSIDEIRIDSTANRSFVEESAGSLTFTTQYVETSSPEWLGSAVGHDGYHVKLYQEGGVPSSRGEAAELKAMTFQEGLGQKLGLSQSELTYLRSLIANVSQLTPYINSQP